MKRSLMSAGLCAVLAATPGLAKKPTPTANPEQVRRLLACRSVADVGQRLACFDREIVTLDQALAKKDVVMIDRQSSAAARRSLFGFSVPSFGGLFGGDEDEVKQIDSTVTSAHRNGEGGWTVRLADGSVWTQTDDNLIALEPRRGDKIIVHRRALGSYTLSVNKQPGVKVRRVG